MKSIKKFMFGTYTKGFVSSYLLFMFTGAILLKLPMSIQDGQTLSWIDAIFISVSGMSTTGLSTVNVSEVLTVFGKVVLAMILQFGGIGLIMMISIFWLVIRKKITFRERTWIMTDQNQIKRSGVVRLVSTMLKIIFTIEVVSFLVMGTYLYFAKYFALKEAYFQAFFLTISMFTNAGFDITGDSLFQYNTDYFMQTLAMFLMFCGAVGFWPLVEFTQWVKAKRKKEKFEFTLFSKILVRMHVGIWLVSAVIVFIFEVNHFFLEADYGFIQSVYCSLFMALTTRNAGFATMNVADFSSPTQMLFSVLMFVGSSPNSAGGGIRTTTVLLTILGLYSFANGKEQVVIERKAMKMETVQKSFIVLIGATMLCVFSSILMSLTENVEIHMIIFEVCSAFGTTGLSLGITGGLSFFGKVVLIITMFIGRIGILALLLLFRPHRPKNNIKYPEIDIIVG